MGTEASDFTGQMVNPFTMTNDNGIDNPILNNYANYRNTIIPQALTNASGDLKFRITISANGSATDAYETVLGIKEIMVKEGDAPKKYITAWAPGKRYIYNLHITKTGISVTATVTDWKTVDASEDIWM